MQIGSATAGSMTLSRIQKISGFQSQPEKYWDRLFAPSFCLAVITIVSRSGVVNAAAFGTCTRVHHNPVYITFTTSMGNDTAVNVLETGEFVANLPPFEEKVLERVI